jgi:hypothetical protein
LGTAARQRSRRRFTLLAFWVSCALGTRTNLAGAIEQRRTRTDTSPYLRNGILGKDAGEPVTQPNLGAAAGRIAREKVAGCFTTILFFGFALLVYVALPERFHRYYEVGIGVFFAAAGLLFARRGIRINVFLPFLPLWLFGFVLAAVGCWKSWGKLGLLGAVPIAGLAVWQVVVRVRAELARSP